MAFGYIGVEPTNDKSSNNGVFDITAINKLRKDENLSSEGFDVDFLIVAGGGSSVNALGSGGGGAGNVVSSVDNTGGPGSLLENSFRAYVEKSYPVVVGAGSASQGNNGSASRFSNIISLGGGSGASQNSDSYSGGGGGRFSGTSNRDVSYGTQFDDSSTLYSDMLGHSSDSYIGSSGGYNNGNAGGGGAGGNGSQNAGGVGIICNILSSTDATTESVGQVVSTNVYYAGGGGGGSYGEGSNSGGTGGGGSQQQSGTANTGGGGGGSDSGGAAGAGGSGVVILKYPDTYSINVGIGLTAGSTYTSGGYSVTPIKSGSGDINWSKA
jgi:hypothetical protein